MRVVRIHHHTVRKTAVGGVGYSVSPQVDRERVIPNFESDRVIWGARVDTPPAERKNDPTPLMVEIRSLVRELGQRFSRDPLTLSRGECVAVLTGKSEGNRIYLMRILGTDNGDAGRKISYTGVVIEPTRDGTYQWKQVSREPGGESPSRILRKEDRVVALQPEEVGKFLPDAGAEEGAKGEPTKLSDIDGLAEQWFVSLLRNKTEAVILAGAPDRFPY